MIFVAINDPRIVETKDVTHVVNISAVKLAQKFNNLDKVNREEEKKAIPSPVNAEGENNQVKTTV